MCRDRYGIFSIPYYEYSHHIFRGLLKKTSMNKKTGNIKRSAGGNVGAFVSFTFDRPI